MISYSFISVFLLIPRPPYSTLFPYTTLFRSASKPSRTRRTLPHALRSRRRRSTSGALLTEDRPAALVRGRTILRQECRSEEHTSELQSRPHLVCRLLLEKKKKN